MSGFYITIKNGLLDPKHIKAMGGDRGIGTVWLFMWFLDKMTIIDEEKGEGKVLGGKPIQFERIQADLKISRATYKRWLEMLRIGGYISTVRTPYGLCITVYKAFKIFGKKENKEKAQPRANTVSDVSHLPIVGEPSNKMNKTRQLDNTVDIRENTPAEIAREFFNNSEKQLEVVKVLVIKGISEPTAVVEIKKFVAYWTEPTKSGRQQKWETERTFEIRRRLVRWFGNKIKWDREKVLETKGIRI